jgi:hypothetical protein
LCCFGCNLQNKKIRQCYSRIDDKIISEKKKNRLRKS